VYLNRYLAYTNIANIQEADTDIDDTDIYYGVTDISVSPNKLANQCISLTLHSDQSERSFPRLFI
jgi:hypothetical protein